LPTRFPHARLALSNELNVVDALDEDSAEITRVGSEFTWSPRDEDE
jgi:hypothetical protein